MEVFIWFMFFVYGFMLLYILLYSILQFTLAVRYRFANKSTKMAQLTNFPMVTVQLPLYNENYVVSRLIEAVCELDYPKDKLEIQILDDSTDDSKELVDLEVAKWKEKGIDITVVRREKRVGFKAGALAYGLETAKGEFVAIFDADFVPRKEFLLKALPAFSSPEVGLVQSRWEHLNKGFNLLTKLQAFGLDAHFTVEQGGRNLGDHFINFNGTAGVWRKTTIANAGGWQSDTLTEDLDLSYRAQLKGWKFKFLEELGSPAELPPEMNALKTQQYRWTKGGAECAVKNLPEVYRNKQLHWTSKVHASFHLLNTFVFVCILFTGILSLPMIWIKHNYQEFTLFFEVASLFSVSFIFLGYFYWASQRRRRTQSPWKAALFFVDFPLFISVFSGLSLHNAIAVVEGYLGRKSPFIRTPKFNVNNKGETWKGNRYLRHGVNPVTYIEVLLGMYFLYAIYIGLTYSDYGLMPFHLMLAGGFFTVAFLSFKHQASY